MNSWLPPIEERTDYVLIARFLDRMPALKQLGRLAAERSPRVNRSEYLRELFADQSERSAKPRSLQLSDWLWLGIPSFVSVVLFII